MGSPPRPLPAPPPPETPHRKGGPDRGALGTLGGVPSSRPRRRGARATHDSGQGVRRTSGRVLVAPEGGRGRDQPAVRPPVPQSEGRTGRPATGVRGPAPTRQADARPPGKRTLFPPRGLPGEAGPRERRWGRRGARCISGRKPGDAPHADGRLRGDPPLPSRAAVAAPSSRPFRAGGRAEGGAPAVSSLPSNASL